MKWLLLLAFASPQARPLPVTGVVVDPSLRALPGARVEITANDGTPAASTTTSRDGAFRVLLVPGRYTVTVAFSGFASARQVVDVLGPLHLELSLALPLLSEEVSVTATRNEERVDRAPQPVSIVTHEEIELRQSVNLAELLTTLPGVQLTESGPFRLRPVLRGLDSNRLLVLVDGQRLNNGRTSTANSGIETSLVDLDQIERVEIVRGAVSVLHGSDAMAGVIDIITRTPDRSAAAHPFGAFEGGYATASSVEVSFPRRATPQRPSGRPQLLPRLARLRKTRRHGAHEVLSRHCPRWPARGTRRSDTLPR